MVNAAAIIKLTLTLFEKNFLLIRLPKKFRHKMIVSKTVYFRLAKNPEITSLID